MALWATMNKRWYILFIAVTITVTIAAQGLRNSVCVVYPECEKEDSVVLADYARQLARAGFIQDAQSLRAHIGNSFGSGVVTDKYVLTNRHVVGYAKTVKLVFDIQGQSVSYEHCRVISTSMDADIAAIELPREAKGLVPLTLSPENVSDGEEVYAAGFPGLISNPSWQLTRGAISNAKLQIDNATYIQHTAAIDPGSSGGPLLRKTDDQYEVIGLNTMKAFGRDRVGIAVSTQQLEAFLHAAPDETTQHVLEQMRSVDSELWIQYYTLLPDSMKHLLHDMNVQLPMDRVLAVAAYYGGPDQMQSKPQKHKRLPHKQTDHRLILNQPGICELETSWTTYLSYEFFRHHNNYYHIPSINADFNSRYLFYGLCLGVPIGQDSTIAISSGMHTGVQIPIRLAAHHILLPKASVELQYVNSLTSHYDVGGLSLPIRVGTDYHYEMINHSLVLGIRYGLRPAWNHSIHPQWQHTVSVHLGLAF